MVPTDDLARRIDRLSNRLSRIEAHLGLATGLELLLEERMAHGPRGDRPVAPSASPPEAAVPPRPRRAAASPPLAPTPVRPPPPTVQQPPALPQLEEQPDRVPIPVAERPAARPAAVPPKPVQPDPVAPPASRPLREQPSEAGLNLERAIGGRIFAALGAVAVVIGVGLFLKLAYDRGWLDRIPPVGKCLSGGAFGLVLLGLGETARRKINAAASVGLSAAGLGALFASAYAAYGVYALVPSAAAFAMLAGVAGLGIAVGVRANLASVALLSLLAAYTVPLILGDSPAPPAVLPLYLTALLGVGLGLSGWRPSPFFVLRSVTWWATVLLGSWWTLSAGLDHPVIALPFLAVFWGAVHGEMLAAAARGGLVPGEAAPPGKWLSRRAVRPIAGSFSTTAWCVLLSLAVLRSGTTLAGWMSPAAGAVAAFVLGLILAGHLRVLRDTPGSDAQRLGAALHMQAGALVIAAVALAFHGWLEVTAWLALGVAAVGAGRWIRARGLEVYGLVVLTIATARLMLLEWWATPVAFGGTTVVGFHLTNWSLLVAFAGAAWIAASFLMRGAAAEPSRRRLASCDATLGLGLTITALCGSHTQTAFESAVTALVVLALACGAAGVRFRSPGLAVYAGLVLALGSMVTLGRFPGLWSTLMPLGGLVPTGWMYAMLLCGSAWLGVAWALGRVLGEPGRVGAAVCSTIGLAMMLAAFVHPWAGAASVALVWSAAGLAILAWARWGPAAGARVAGAQGVVALAAAVVCLLGSAWWDARHVVAGATLLGFHMTWLSACVAAVGGAWLIAARLLSRGALATALPSPHTSIGALSAGLALLAASTLHELTSFESAMTALAALAAAYAIIGDRREYRPLRVGAMAVLAIATLVTLIRFNDFQISESTVPSLTLGGLVLTGWTYAMLLVGATWLLYARLTVRRGARVEFLRTGAVAAAAVGLGMLLGSVLHEEAVAAWVCLVWLAIGAAAAGAHTLLPLLAMDVLGLIIVGLAMVVWVMAYPFGGQDPGGWFRSAAPVGLHPGMWSAGAIIATAGLLRRWLGRRSTVHEVPSAVLLPIVPAVCAVLGLVATSFEAARFGGMISSDPGARHAAVSIWWGLFAGGLLAYGFGRAMPLARHAGLALLGLAAAKAVLIDLAGAPQAWRVASFLGLGLLMLGVAVLYARASARLTPAGGPR